MTNSTDGKRMEPMEVQNLKLRSSIHHLWEEQNRSNTKLIGVQVLTDQLEKKNEECIAFKSKARQYEVLLARAENRIAQLSMTVKNYAKGAGSSRQSGIVTPGVSKKLLESLTKENKSLKLTLEHVLNKQPNGVELAVENRDLHELVLALKEELEQNKKETEELRQALTAVETDDSMALQEQIARLTAQLTQIERSLKAKQVYCESVVNDNEQLKSSLEAVKSERIAQLATLNNLKDQYPAIKEVLDLTWSNDDIDGEAKDKEKKEKKIESLQRTVEELKEQRATSFEQSKKRQEELVRQIQDLTHDRDTSKNEQEKLQKDYQEECLMKELLEGQCKDFENDFKLERQEKEKLASEVKKLMKRNQELQQENMVVKSENERIRKLIQSNYERKAKQKVTSPTTNTHWQNAALGACGFAQTNFEPPHFNPMKYSEQVVADGPRGKDPFGRKNTESANSYLECPVCKMILPPSEIEDHLNDCDGRK